MDQDDFWKKWILMEKIGMRPEALAKNRFEMARNFFLIDLFAFVQRQALDEGLWARAQYASEAHIQKGLRDLHDKIEVAFGKRTGPMGDRNGQ